jgi:hypothetical protein
MTSVRVDVDVGVRLSMQVMRSCIGCRDLWASVNEAVPAWSMVQQSAQGDLWAGMNVQDLGFKVKV